MRVLFLTPSVRMLGARQSLRLLAGALPPGVEPLVVCPSDGELTQELRAINVPVDVVPHGAWRKLPGRLKSVFLQIPKMRSVARRFRPDIVHANEFHIIPQGAMLAGEIVGEPRSVRPGAGGKRGIVGHVRLSITPRQIRNYHLADCRRIVAVSHACAALFAGSGLEDGVRVVHNGVDVAALGTGDDGPALREAWGWAPEETLACCLLGLVSERKNQLVAVEATVRANALGAPVRLLLAGDAFKGSLAYGEQLRARLAADDARALVRWLPFQKDVASLYRACDVNLLVSGEEGFGRTIIEAGVLGLPSIGSRVGGIPELVDEGKTGWLVGDGDAEALALAMVEAWRDRARLRAMGDAARERALGHFTLEAHARRMVEVWEEARG